MKTAQMMMDVRNKCPLVVHTTNIVTVNDCANVCLCAGGSPCMSTDPSDVADLVKIADAVVVNVGTPDSAVIGETLYTAAKVATEMHKPLVLDPVGAGASGLRTSLTKKIIDECISVSPSTCIIKGNAGEIGFLSGLGGKVRGVDSAGASDAEASTLSLARDLGCVVSCTGEIDYVSDGEKVVKLTRGTPMEATVSGTGCMVSSVTGCYAGACGVSLESAAAAITVFNVAAEKATRISNGPGTFRINLLDALHGLVKEDL